MGPFAGTFFFEAEGEGFEPSSRPEDVKRFSRPLKRSSETVSATAASRATT